MFGLFCDMSQIKVCQNSCDNLGSGSGLLGPRPSLTGRSSIYAHPEKNHIFNSSDAYRPPSDTQRPTNQIILNKRGNSQSQLNRYNVHINDGNSSRQKFNNNNTFDRYYEDL